jgi:TetR/AcrR family transcriptional regulator, tetracycline repressor protein
MAPRKKDAEQLTRERIVDAAMRVIDEEGVDALSMRRLGSELGVNPMAAYHYVPNKAALYDLVLDAVMSAVDVSSIDASAPLDERMKQAGRAYRAAILRHPRAIPVLVSRSVRSATALRPIEAFLGLLFEAGLDPVQATAAVDVVAQYILGGAMGYYHHMVDAEAGEQREFDPLPPEQFPNMNRALAGGAYLGFDEEFEFGMDTIVRGLLSLAHRDS